MASLMKFVSNGGLNTTRLLLSTPSLVNSSLNYSSKFNKIVQKLGISEPPKKPLTGFFRFIQENKSTVSKSNGIEMSNEITSRWKKLTDAQRQQYNNAYKNDLVEYSKLYAAYLSSLTLQQKEAIKSEKKQQKEIQAQIIAKKLKKDEETSLGKPKKAPNSFQLYVSDKCKNTHLRASDVKGDWKNLSEAVKQVYQQKSQQQRESYTDALKVWEDKMMKEGNGHLVRKIRFLTKPSEEKKTHKNSTA